MRALRLLIAVFSVFALGQSAGAVPLPDKGSSSITGATATVGSKIYRIHRLSDMDLA